jgi:hypothetical protein
MTAWMKQNPFMSAEGMKAIINWLMAYKKG